MRGRVRLRWCLTGRFLLNPIPFQNFKPHPLDWSYRIRPNRPFLNRFGGTNLATPLAPNIIPPTHQKKILFKTPKCFTLLPPREMYSWNRGRVLSNKPETKVGGFTACLLSRRAAWGATCAPGDAERGKYRRKTTARQIVISFLYFQIYRKRNLNMWWRREGWAAGWGCSGRGSTCLLKTHFLPGGNEKRFERIRKAMDD